MTTIKSNIAIILGALAFIAAMCFIVINAPVVVTVIGIIWIGLTVIYMNKHRIDARRLRTPWYIISLAVLIFFAAWPLNGFHKGMTVEMFTQMSYPKAVLAASVLNTPSKDLPENELNNLYYFYKFDCDDCIEAEPHLQSLFARYDVQPYRVSSRSEQGKALVEKYSITTVPCLLYTGSEPNEFYIELAYSAQNFNMSGLTEVIARYKNANNN